MKLRLSIAAQKDLQEIYSYTIKTWGETQADNYVDSLWRTFQKISKAPHEYRFREDLYKNCQLAAHGKHLILFRCQDADIEIARILHSAMDAKRHI